jgi:hypothetical protein
MPHVIRIKMWKCSECNFRSSRKKNLFDHFNDPWLEDEDDCWAGHPILYWHEIYE